MVILLLILGKSLTISIGSFVSLSNGNISDSEDCLIYLSDCSDFTLLDAKRHFIEDSYDFKIETESVYSNFRLVEIACSIIINRLNKLLDTFKTNPELIYLSNDTIDNCYICTLENEDYTIGKILENKLYNLYFNNKKILSYCGFKTTST